MTRPDGRAPAPPAPDAGPNGCPPQKAAPPGGEPFRLVDMATLAPALLDEAARLLSAALPRGWATPEEAAQEIRGRLVPENNLVAALVGGRVAGFGGILPLYDTTVFELHPLAVDKTFRGRGIGRALIAELERMARARGGLTIYLGADDDGPEGETSLAGTDLYDDLPDKLARFEAGTHQSAFYLKMGYTLVGVVPDASGPGRPDIFFAKRLCAPGE